MLKSLLVSVSLAALGASPAAAQTQRPDQLEFRALYKELVETNTELSSGSCTLAASRMAARLKAAGYTDAELHSFAADGHPKEGGLVAVLKGTDPKARPNYDLWLMRYTKSADLIGPGPITRITDHSSADVLPVFSTVSSAARLPSLRTMLV